MPAPNKNKHETKVLGTNKEVKAQNVKPPKATNEPCSPIFVPLFITDNTDAVQMPTPTTLVKVIQYAIGVLPIFLNTNVSNIPSITEVRYSSEVFSPLAFPHLYLKNIATTP